MRIWRGYFTVALLLTLLGAFLLPAGRATAAGPWNAGTPPPQELAGDTAALLPDGKVFVRANQSAGVYDPGSDRWAVVRSGLNPLDAPALTTLRDGSVLVIGGLSCGHCGGGNVERYDPRQGTVTSLKSMHQARGRHTATTLADGRVLVTGGGPVPPARSPRPNSTTRPRTPGPLAHRWSSVGSSTPPRS